MFIPKYSLAIDFPICYNIDKVRKVPDSPQIIVRASERKEVDVMKNMTTEVAVL